MALVLAGLSGCTTFSTLDKGLQTFVGKPPQEAFDVMGYPKGEDRIAGRTVYVWGRHFSMAMPLSTNSTTTGSVAGTPFTATTSGTQWVDGEYECNVRLFVGDDGLVRNYDWSGNMGGCEAFAHRLKGRVKR
jgi:hypothetical protein